MSEKEQQKPFSIKEAFLKWFGLFLVVIASLAVFFVVDNASSIVSTFGSYIGILRPVVYGCVIAYILNPLMKLIQNSIMRFLERKGRQASQKKKGLVTGISITLSLLLGIIIIIVLCWMILPQLVASVYSLVENLPSKANYYYNMLNESIRNNKFLADTMQEVALNATKYMDEMVNTKLLPWMQTDLLPSVNLVAMEFANGVMSVLNVLYNLFIGIIVAIYILASKDTFAAQAKKVAYGIFKKEHADTVIRYVRISHGMFSGFIIGKIVDSTIVGILCFVAMTVLGLPYALLISVIIGVTNIIPVFGPYLGLIPSVFLILIVNPMQALYFVILIAILQQIDGNIIGPAILGESTGLSAFWVLFSILLFGGLWGIVGMIIGVPLFAVIYRIVADFINWKLLGRDLSTVTDQYLNLKCITVDGDEVSYIEYSDEELHRKEEEKRRKRAALKEKYLNLKWLKRKKKQP
jgi:predicted PurR-regulated permease PerM